MNDRELMEAAAKAAGIGLTKKFLIADSVAKTKTGDSWAPLIDDGDALRLAVRLGLRVECSLDGQAYVWRGDDLIWNEFALHENVDGQRRAATRRAIVRAAVEIGGAE